MVPSKHFPDGFDFFDLGTVKSMGTPRTMAEPKLLITFALVGEETGTCLIWFESKLADESMAVELANILASKFVNNLCDDEGLDIEMSPPRVIDAQEKLHKKLSSYTLRGAEGAKRGRSYLYDGSVGRIKINLIYIESQRGTA